MKEAPLALESAALYAAILREVLGWSEAPAVLLGRRLIEHAAEVAEGCRLALAFPSERPVFVAEADFALSRLRTGLAAAEAAGLIAVGAHVRFTESIDEIGKMVGGWRRSLAE